MKRKLLVGLAMYSLSVTGSNAFNLRPETKLDDEIIALKEADFGEWIISDLSRSIIGRFTEPVHEIITNKAWGCKNGTPTATADDDECSPGRANGKITAPQAVLAGVQWNDNPYFQLLRTGLTKCQDKYIWLPAEPACWALVFKKGEKDARAGKKFNLQSEDVLLLRSHFGDLQFLHSMRAEKNETPKQTQEKILMWAEFMWNGALGKFSRGTTVAEIKTPGLTNHFYPSDTIQRIFFRGNPTHLDEFPMFALGSLIHMVEDSFSASHVVREKEGAGGQTCPGSKHYQPARIVAFQNYAEQDSHEHAKSDTYVAMSSRALHESPSVIGVVQTLRQMFDSKAEWETEAGPYIRCIFGLVP